jgi:DNA-binding NarL/FixJ family response regulator
MATLLEERTMTLGYTLARTGQRGAGAAGGGMSTPTIGVMTVDDHPLMRQGLVVTINDEADMRIVAEVASGAAAIEAYRVHSPDITLMDLRLPDMTGIDALRAIRAASPGARVVMLTTFEGDADIHQSLRAGACGYLLKSTPPAELIETIRLVHAGKKRIPSNVAAHLAEHLSDDELTPRETEVLRLVAEGHHNREIAERLFVSDETVKAHLKNIMGKLGASDRTQAVTIALRRGFIRL